MTRNAYPTTYGGWRLYDRGPGSHPVTGRFYAVRFGVRIGHSTAEGLRRMMDTRNQEARESWLRRRRQCESTTR